MWEYTNSPELAGTAGGKVITVGENITAINAESGETDWTFNEAQRGDYTLPVIADAIYFGVFDDAGGSEYGDVYAVTFGGEERWSVETGSVYTPPFTREGVVYVGGDDGNVRAIDSAEGAILWEVDLFPDSLPSIVDVIGVDDEVYATTGQLTALDKSDGKIRWQYGNESDHISQISKTDAVVITSFWDDLIALDEGEEIWSAGLDEGSKRLHGTAGGHVFVEQADTLYAFDTENGEQRWTVDGVEALSLTDHTAYIGNRRVQAISINSGDQRWQNELNSAVRSISVQSTAPDSTRQVPRQNEEVAVTTDRQLLVLDSEGTVQWQREFDQEVFDHLYDGLLFCRTANSIYAFI
ncbi:PQQ-binding-like beta-propeller repeat protein [Halosimplex salinum]|uniref:PQQ-binding-like beta-propeller repeat protein n=1 Tax=Halosimplex salinum TaxID=1710538 RepID=UPI000F485AEE|nr:PQQ-binding-like beta-propeller repeat protein [Halosimplex salinum]